jgi:serine/threonine protein kinase
MVRKGAMKGGGGVRLVPGLDVRAGQTIAVKYRVEELVGSGASGIVLSARNIHLRERVALKIFASYTDGQDELLRRRLEKARLASALRGAHVAHIVEIGNTEEGMPFVATDWLEGATLEAELADRERLPESEAARWVLEACEGLAEAHALGLVHGDLKPQNILLSEPKKKRRGSVDVEALPPHVDPRILKILDFGTTSPLDAIGDQSASAFFGSPAFLAPEQIEGGTVDARADVWALGVLLYNALSGALPFEADTVSGVLVAVVHDAPALLTEAPYGLARLVHHCLDKDPARRPQNVAALADELAPFAGELGAGLAARTRAMLEGRSEMAAPPIDASASGSLPPVSMSTRPPPLPASLPSASMTLPSRRVVTTATGPSARVIAEQRRFRSRATAVTLVGAACAIALASWATANPWALPAFLLAKPGPADEPAITAPAAPPPPAATAPVPPAEEPPAMEMDEPSSPPPEMPAEPEPSSLTLAPTFAPAQDKAMTPTPLAVTPTPLATAAAFATAAVPVAPAAPVRPPPYVLPAPTTMRLPAGLPRTRDGLPPPLPPPAARADRK